MPLKYTQDHEWIELEGDIAKVGISDFAQQQLGDVVFVELPQIGAKLEKGAEAAVIESVKAASEVYAPLAGEILEVNSALEDNPSTVNSAPETEGWFFKMRMGDAGEIADLMDANAYQTFVENS